MVPHGLPVTPIHRVHSVTPNIHAGCACECVCVRSWGRGKPEGALCPLSIPVWDHDSHSV